MMNNTVALRKQLHNVFLIVDDEYEMRAAPDNVKKQAEKEVKLLSQLNHANIVKYRESFIGGYDTQVFTKDVRLTIVLSKFELIEETRDIST